MKNFKQLSKNEMKKINGGLVPVNGCNAQACNYYDSNTGKTKTSYCATVYQSGTSGVCECIDSGGLYCNLS